MYALGIVQNEWCKIIMDKINIAPFHRSIAEIPAKILRPSRVIGFGSIKNFPPKRIKPKTIKINNGSVAIFVARNKIDNEVNVMDAPTINQAKESSNERL